MHYLFFFFRNRFFFFLCISWYASSAQAQIDVSKLEAANVLWTTAEDSPDAFMPTGNGEYALNVWANQNNEVYMYISSTCSWGEKLYQNNSTGSDGSGPNKLAKIRLVFPPNTWSTAFTQTLQLHESRIQLTGGAGDNKITLMIWVDANKPVIHLQASSVNPFSMSAYAEQWPGSIGSAIQPVSTSSYTNGVSWYYRNHDLTGGHTMFDSTMTAEFGAGNAIGTDPIRNLTYGALMKGDGFIKTQQSISSSGQNSYSISVYPQVEQTPDIQTWVSQLDNTIAMVDATDIGDAEQDHLQWWDEFWNRSWIFLEGNSPDVINVTQDYILQRYISACAGRGRYPIKFNGSVFLADNAPSGVSASPDVRVWGPHYWAQNTRLIYWPMLAAGDYDMMRPFFSLYMRALPVRLAQTKAIYGTNGAVWPEVMTIFGTFSIEHYKAQNGYIWRHYTGSLELLTMMLDVYSHTKDPQFLSDTIIPASEQVLTFFEEHFTTQDANGKIILNNLNALETYWNIDNSAPDIAGLRDVLDKLLALPESYDPALRTRWASFRQTIPGLPVTGSGAKKKLLPHGSQGAPSHNVEAPELYSVFPFRIYGKTKPDLATAIYTYDQRQIYADNDWRQDPIWAAYLGKTDQAKQLLISRYSNKSWLYRFPAIYGPFYDWIPDQCHANVANLTLQAMLMHTDEDSIYLFPAWPDDWDVSFKLHAPKQTTVEVVYANGEVSSLKVTPAEREKDVVILNKKTPTGIFPSLNQTEIFTCYPVPATDILFIKTILNLSTASIVLINSVGVQIPAEVTLNADGTASLNVKNISRGIYVIKVVSGDRSVIQKIMIE